MNLKEFDSNSIDSVLMPNKLIVTLPKMYTVTFGCKKNVLEDVSDASLALHPKDFASATEKNFVPKFTNRLSLTRHKIRKYEGSLYQIFPHMDRIRRRIRKNTYQRKPAYLHILISVTHFIYWPRNVHIIEQE